MSSKMPERMPAPFGKITTFEWRTKPFPMDSKVLKQELLEVEALENCGLLPIDKIALCDKKRKEINRRHDAKRRPKKGNKCT